MDYIEKYQSKLKDLNETLWENRVPWHLICKWLDVFETENEKKSALFLLSHFMYYNVPIMRHLLIALFRDNYRYPIIAEYRTTHEYDMQDLYVEQYFQSILCHSYFLPIGNPSESGAHMLYFFRQTNHLSRRNFVTTDQVLSSLEMDENSAFKDAKYFIFIDDFCGTGTQVEHDNSVKRFVKNIKDRNDSVNIFYFPIFATEDGLKKLKDSQVFTKVECAVMLDETYKCFGNYSRFFNEQTDVSKQDAKALSEKYSRSIIADEYDHDSAIQKRFTKEKWIENNLLGYGDCQLLIGFYHNTPNNTIPIFWGECNGRVPVFKRYQKIYGDEYRKSI